MKNRKTKIYDGLLTAMIIVTLPIETVACIIVCQFKKGRRWLESRIEDCEQNLRLLKEHGVQEKYPHFIKLSERIVFEEREFAEMMDEESQQ